MGNSDQNHGSHFVISSEILMKTALFLGLMTILTVATAKIHAVHAFLGVFAGLVAFAIAFFKAMAVMMYFMGLKYDTKLNQIVFGSGFFFLGLLFICCAIDIWTRVQIQSTL
jgi:cytochrome c oxidase subunit 4